MESKMPVFPPVKDNLSFWIILLAPALYLMLGVLGARGNPLNSRSPFRDFYPIEETQNDGNH